MTLEEAVERACKAGSLVDALAWIATWEAERAIKQALEFQRTGVSTAAQGGWDTCFGACFRAVIEKHPDRICPAGSTLLPASRFEAEIMNIVSERYLWPERFKTAAAPIDPKMTGEPGLEPGASGFGDRRSST